MSGTPRLNPGVFLAWVHIYGIEGNDEVTVCSTGWEGTSYVTRRGSGDCRVSTGAGGMEPPSGVWEVRAFANGYTVEPESYRVALKDGKVVEPNQVLKFVFQKVS